MNMVNSQPHKLGKAFTGMTGSKYNSSVLTGQNVKLTDLISLIKKDTDTIASLFNWVNKLIAEETMFTGKNSKQVTSKDLSDYNHDDFLTQFYLNYVTYWNVFVSMKMNAGQFLGFEVLDYEKCEILTDDNNDKFLAILYTQPDGTIKTIDKQYCTHVSLYPFKSDRYGFNRIEALYDVLTAKIYLENFKSYLIKTNQFRNAYSYPDSNSNKMEINKKNMVEFKRDPHLDLYVAGILNIQSIRDLNDLTKLDVALEVFTRKINTLFQEPPSMYGRTENSNRSTGDGEFRHLRPNFKTYKKRITSAFNNHILPLIGECEFNFIENDIDDIRTLVDIAGSMKQTGFTPNFIVKFLKEHGFNIKKSDLTEDLDLDKNSNLQPSRKPQKKDINDFGKDVKARKEGISK